MIETELVTALTGYAPLAAIINTRLFAQPPTGLPQTAALPAVTYQRISSVPVYGHSGRQLLRSTRMQFNCYGRTTLEAAALATALQAGMDAFKWRNFLTGPRYLSDPVTKTQYPAVDAVIWHQE